MKLRHLLPLALIFFAATGCVTLDMLLEVQADGSGKLISEVRVQKAFLQMAEGALGGGGELETSDLFSAANLEKMAERFGPNAKLVSREPLEDTFSRGARAVFSIPDVRKMSLDGLPVAPTRGSASTFALAPGEGGTTVLTLAFPEPETVKPGPMIQASELEGMKQLLSGFRLRFDVAVPGKLVATNSPFAKGNRMTVVALDFDQLVADPKAVEAITTNNATTIAQVGQLLNPFSGASFHPHEELRIEFRAPQPNKPKSSQPKPSQPKSSQPKSSELSKSSSAPQATDGANSSDGGSEAP